MPAKHTRGQSVSLVTRALGARRRQLHLVADLLDAIRSIHQQLVLHNVITYGQNTVAAFTVVFSSHVQRRNLCTHIPVIG